MHAASTSDIKSRKRKFSGIGQSKTISWKHKELSLGEPLPVRA